MIAEAGELESNLMSIRDNAEKVAALAAAHPNPAMMKALASVSDKTWRAMMVSLRYSGDLRRIAEALNAP